MFRNNFSNMKSAYHRHEFLSIIASLTVLIVHVYAGVVKMFISKIESKPSYVESLNVEHFVSILKSQTVFISSKW